MNHDRISRRLLLKRAGALGLLAAVERLFPACAWTSAANVSAAKAGSQAVLSGDVIDLTINEQLFRVDGQTGTAVTINGTIPGPVIRLKEGQQATLRVTNRLTESTSIHWHGILLPPKMDGVPGVSFGGIEPGTTFTYRFPVRQSGTYWFHSHSGGQELAGMYAPMILDPIEPEPFQYDRDYVVMLSDWSFESTETLISNLKKRDGYYNFQKRTAREFFSDVARLGWWAAVDNYLMWDRMRMDPTDFADVTSYALTHLINGLSPAANWTGLFRPGERVRLRFINAAAMTFYDVRVPGLKMTVVQVDGQNVQPVVVEEFRIGVAETYDVLIEPVEDRAYTIFAETIDRSGYARGALATRAGMSADIPARRPRPLRTMEDMGMHMEGMGMKGMDMPGMEHSKGGGMKKPGMNPSGEVPHMNPSGDKPNMEQKQHGPGMQHMQGMHEMPGMEKGDQRRTKMPGTEPIKHGPDHHGTGNQMVAEYSRNRMEEPGRGLEHSKRRVLVYTDLKSLEPYPDQREPEREIELHLTGNMPRFMWSFDGKKYSEAKDPIRFHYGERVRLTFVNDTMMEHPLHLHGMWMHLENGAGQYLPRKHTVIVKPAERVSVAVTADAPGRWAFHCHLLLHMEAGMFRVVEVSDNRARDALMTVSLRVVLVTAVACLFSAGIGGMVATAEIPLQGSRSPMSSHVTDTFTATKALASSAAPKAPVPVGPSAGPGQTQSNLPLQPGWPSPVHDQQTRTFMLVDVLEYRPRPGGGEGNDDYRWDIEGWYGGDYNRLWFKSEGQRDTAFKADYDVDFQLLYGRFIQRYYDFQVGGRLETQSFRGRNVTRGLAAIGIEGLVPFSYGIEPVLFIAQNGAVSARLAVTKDLSLTQRLIFQARFETNAAIQRVEEFTTGSGLNNLEFGVRLRYEIRREFAPYVGFSVDRSFGETATLVREEGGNPSQIRFVAGVRMWF